MQHIIDPPAARRRVMAVLAQYECNVARAAAALAVSYATLHRLIATDPELERNVVALRAMLRARGCPQRGWGRWHERTTQKAAQGQDVKGDRE